MGKLRVSNPPPKPLLIWDGDCEFCRLWVERWRILVGDTADDATFQQAAVRFPEIPREKFERAVIYIDTSGTVFSGAEAMFHSLTGRSRYRWLSGGYDHVPGFAALSEFFYRIIARHRRISSAITSALWGKNVRPPVYHQTQRWFLRGLGLVYLIAFVSFWTQADGLIGANGILPVASFLGDVREQAGSSAIWFLPTLCWFNSSDAFLHLLCGAGVILSILLMAGLVPVICLIGLFVLYLSLTIAGQTFFHFQWDILLLETGFLALFFAPTRLWLGRPAQDHVPRLGLFLLKLLLFKLMFMSGVVKITSGDDSWWNLTALDYHYWSQPLPTVFAWFADTHPEWFKHFSVGVCLIIEIITPFFIWAPRRLRLAAAGLLIGLQLVIAITGNYCFFNLLTIVLCLLLIDDSIWGKWHRLPADGPSRTGISSASGRCHDKRRDQESRPLSTQWMARLQTIAAAIVLIVTLPLNAWYIYSAFDPEVDMPRPIAVVAEHIEPFRIASGYGLFRVMTKDRREIIIEGSQNGVDWLPYEFKWKPGDVTHAPGWCAPHQPRLDWQMWFAALSRAGQNPWFLRLVGCLLENKPDVISLLGTNPFPNDGPVYVRARFYRYRFTSADERHHTGAWWKREELGEYLATVSLK